MRRLRLILLGLLALIPAVLGVGWALLHTQALWSWSGRQLVDFAQDRLYPELVVKKVRGHPFTGITFEDITMTSPQGEVLTAKRLELRFSLWSILKLEPVIGRLAVYDPCINIWREADGSLNLTHVLRKRPPPPFSSIDLPDIIVQGGEATFREGDRVTRYPNFDFRCALLVLHPKRPDQAVFVRRALLTVNDPRGPFTLITRLAYQRQELNLLTAEIYAASHLIAVLGGTARFAGEPAAALSGEFKLLSAETIQAFWPEWPGAWTIAGKFTAEATRKEVKATVNGRFSSAEFLLSGRLQKEARWRYEAEMALSELIPDLIAPLNAPLAARLKGLKPVSCRVDARGSGLSWPPSEFQWRVAASPFEHGRAQVQQLELTALGEGREQSLHALIKGNFGRLSLDAKGPLLSQRQGTVNVAAADLKPFFLGVNVSEETLLAGAFTGKADLPGGLALDRLKTQGEFEGSGKWGDIAPVQCRGTVACEEAALRIPQASLEIGGLKTELKGSLTRERVDIQGEGKLPAGGAMPLPTSISGQLSLAFGVKGPWGEPEVSLKGEGQNLSWRDYHIRSARLQAAAKGWLPAAGQFDLTAQQVKAASWVIPQASVTGQGDNRRWRFHIRAPSASGPPLGEVAGSADFSRRPVLVSIQEAAFQARGVAIKNNSPIKIALAPGVALEPAVFAVNQGSIEAEGRMQETGVAGRLEFRQVPAEIFPPLPVKGLFEGQVRLSGTPRSPVIQGRLQAGPGRVSEFSFNTLETTFRYQDALLSFTGLLAEKSRGPRLHWEGALPLNISLQPLNWQWREADVHVLVKGEKADLAMLTAFTPELHEAEGPLDLSAEWRGPIGQPQLTGHIRWGEGTVHLRRAGRAYRLLPGAIHLRGRTLTIPELALESEGAARLSGEMTFRGFAPDEMNLRGTLQNFKALERAGSEASTSGQFSLTGPWKGALLKGNVNLTKASFSTSFFKTGEHDDIVMVHEADKSAQASGAQAVRNGKPAVYQNLTMDLKMASPEGAWVRSKRLKLKVAGSLNLKKARGHDTIYAQGLLHVKEGTVEVHGREFKVTQGEVHLPGVPDEDVTAAMRGVSKVGDITLVLDVYGPVNRPEVQLSSEPSLPPADVLSYLVFSRPAQTLTQQQFRSMGEQVAGILGGFTAKKLKDLLGKDFPLVGDVFVQGSEESMGVAKPLTKDLTVSFERKTEPLARDDTNQVRMDYRLNRYFKVESQLGRRNSGADVFFNFDF
ncbi:MAG: translocation/assembly module TamB domain-containing protein [Deltaproteobacteria bacterium]|nr:translocation/assembly module TamB domain-containing protein [Deltaproteobacteria bacterium]